MPHGCNPTARPGAALMPCGETSGAVRACQGPGLIQELWLPLLRGLSLPQLAGPSWGRALAPSEATAPTPGSAAEGDPQGLGTRSSHSPGELLGRDTLAPVGSNFHRFPLFCVLRASPMLVGGGAGHFLPCSRWVWRAPGVWPRHSPSCSEHILRSLDFFFAPD